MDPASLAALVAMGQKPEQINQPRGGGDYFMRYPFGRGPWALKSGMDTLLEILKSKGATDPRLFNANLLNIQRGTEAQQSSAAERMAQSGMDQSGVGQAILGAIGQGGENRVANARAQEAALQEQRKRDDLNLLLSLIIDPQLRYKALQMGGDQYAAMSGAANRQTTMGMLGALMPLLGMFFGPPGAAAGAAAGTALSSMGSPRGPA